MSCPTARSALRVAPCAAPSAATAGSRKARRSSRQPVTAPAAPHRLRRRRHLRRRPPQPQPANSAVVEAAGARAEPPKPMQSGPPRRAFARGRCRLPPVAQMRTAGRRRCFAVRARAAVPPAAQPAQAVDLCRSVFAVVALGADRRGELLGPARLGAGEPADLRAWRSPICCSISRPTSRNGAQLAQRHRIFRRQRDGHQYRAATRTTCRRS